MMDPLTILSLVANIAQFTEHALQLLSETKSLFRTGHSSVSIAALGVSEVSIRMEYLMTQVELSAQEFTTVGTQSSSASNSPTIENQILDRYREVAIELKEIMGDLHLNSDATGAARLLRSFQAAFSGYKLKKKEKIEKLSKRLHELAREVDSRNISLLRDHQKGLSKDLLEIKSACRSVSEDIGQIRRTTDDCMAAIAQGLSTTLLNLLRSLNLQVDADKMEAIPDVAARPIDPKDIKETLSQFVSKASDLRWQSHILKGLSYPVRDARFRSVKVKEEKTLDWALKGNSLIGLWLKSDMSLFWLTGKAGSGKSTLMKYLCSSNRTLEALKKWSGKLPCIMASHYFWISGSHIQRSVVGLYRSLIFQICSQHTELLRKWRGRQEQSDWSISDLETAFQEIGLATTTEPQFKICIFIDGLDEYDDDDIPDIISVVERLHTSTNIKVLVSSRPWPEFEEAYGNDKRVSTLRMHNLTLQDMTIYTRSKLTKGCGAISTLYRENPKRAQEVVNLISKKAEGVWIWLYLVVRNLVRDLVKFKITVDDIEKRIERTPQDFDKYLEAQLGRGDPQFREQSARIFLAVTAAGGSLPALGVRLLLLGFSPDSIKRGHEARYVGSAVEENNALFFSDIKTPIDYDPLRKKLNSRCKDLIQIEVPSGEHFLSPKDKDISAVFIHRCVADFFRESHGAKSLKDDSQLSEPFDPKLFLLAVYVIIIRCATCFHASDGSSSCGLASKATTEIKETDVSFERLLEFLDKSLQLSNEIDERISSEVSHSIITRNVGCSPSKLDSLEVAFWKTLDLRYTSLTNSSLEHIKHFHRLIDKMNDAISTTLVVALRFLRVNDSPLPIETMLFAGFALTANLNTYVKRLVLVDKRILKYYPQLIFFALHRISLRGYYWNTDSLANPTGGVDQYGFFARYLLGHPSELRNIANSEDVLVINAPHWRAPEDGPNIELVKFFLRCEEVDISKPLRNIVNITRSNLMERERRQNPFSGLDGPVHQVCYPSGQTGFQNRTPISDMLYPEVSLTLWTFFLSGALYLATGDFNWGTSHSHSDNRFYKTNFGSKQRGKSFEVARILIEKMDSVEECTKRTPGLFGERHRENNPSTQQFKKPSTHFRPTFNSGQHPLSYPPELFMQQPSMPQPFNRKTGVRAAIKDIWGRDDGCLLISLLQREAPQPAPETKNYQYWQKIAMNAPHWQRRIIYDNILASIGKRNNKHPSDGKGRNLFERISKRPIEPDETPEATAKRLKKWSRERHFKESQNYYAQRKN